MAQPVAADSVSCRQCGGSVALAALAQRTSCPYCSAAVALSPEQVGRLAGYQSQLAQADAQAAALRQDAARARMARRLIAPGTFFWLPTALVVLPSVATVLVLIGLAQSGVLSPGSLSTVTPVAVSVVALAGVAALVLVLFGRRRDSKGGLALAAREVTCPSCGAQNTLAPRDLGERCSHCGAALLPSARVVAEVMDDARRLLHRERLLGARERRRASIATMDRIADTVSPLGWVGLRPAWKFWAALALGSGAVVVLTAIDLARHGTLGRSPAIGLLILCPILAVVVAVVAVRAQRRALVDAAFAGLAARMGGGVLRGRAGVLGWLDTVWGGALDQSGLGTTHRHRALALAAGGYPVLVELQPDAGFLMAPAQGPARLVVYLAALLPGLPDTPASAAARRWLEATGFSLLVDEGGLRAVAAPALVARMRAAPTLLGEIGPVITVLTNLAQAAGAIPVAPTADA